MRKILLYIRLNVLYIFRNKARFLLTVTGISLGLLVYILGNVFADGYTDNLYKKAYSFDKDSFIVYDGQKKIINKLESYQKKFQINKCNISHNAYSTNNEYTYKNIKVKNAVNLIGVNMGVLESAVLHINEGDILLEKAKLVYGTDFSDEEIKQGKNCVIIEKSTAVFLYQKENAVGEYMDVITPYGYERFVVTGIIEDLTSGKNRNLEFNRIVEEGRESAYSNKFVAYTSYKYIEGMLESGDIEEQYVVNIVEDSNVETVIKELNEQSILYDTDAKITSQGTMLEDVKTLEGKVKGVVNVAIIILVLISGFVIVTIYTFSVKERTYEIGVRRALGASESDIVRQFITEGMVTAVISGIVTLMISVIICNFVTAYFVGSLYMDIRFVISRELIFSMFGISILEGIIFCFIPAVMASKIRPSEAVRWD